MLSESMKLNDCLISHCKDVSYYFFELHHVACVFFVTQTGIEPMPAAVEALSSPVDHEGSPFFKLTSHD